MIVVVYNKELGEDSMEKKLLKKQHVGIMQTLILFHIEVFSLDK